MMHHEVIVSFLVFEVSIPAVEVLPELALHQGPDSLLGIENAGIARLIQGLKVVFQRLLRELCVMRTMVIHNQVGFVPTVGVSEVESNFIKESPEFNLISRPCTHEYRLCQTRSQGSKHGH